MSETRLLAFGDVHQSAIPPRARTAAYPKQIDAKLRWLAAACTKLKVTQAICTGDLFHRKAPEEADITALVRAFQRFPNGCVLSIPGNHDTTSPGNIAGTAFEVLVAAGVVVDLTKGSWPCLDAHNNPNVTVTGVPWKPEKDLQSEEAYEAAEDIEHPEVRITHGMLVPDDRDYPFTATPVTSIAKHSDHPYLLINGHNHRYFTAGHRINIGSICRISRDEAEMNDGNRYAVLVIIKDGKIEYRQIPIPVAAIEDSFRDEDGSEIDDTEEVDKRARDDKIMDLADTIAAELDVLSADPEVLIHKIAKEMNFSKDVVESALSGLSSARDRLNA